MKNYEKLKKLHNQIDTLLDANTTSSSHEFKSWHAECISFITNYYGKSRGIVNLNLSVEEGDFFGFIGPNGAGKSTTIRILLGLITPTSGSARIWNMDCGLSKTQILRQVGYMPSEAFYYDDMKVKDVIRFAADARKMDCREEATRICDLLEVDKNKKIQELSLGNRKKVSIVCAMQHKPKLLILDEPTSGLDPLMQEAFFKLILEYNRQGTTCFLSSHVLSEIKRYCKNAAIIREGKIIRTDTVENLAKSDMRRVKIREHGQQKEFVHTGSMKELLEKLSGMELEDLLIEEPSLDEIFMHYYEH